MREKSKKGTIVMELLLIGMIVSAGCVGEKALEDGTGAPTGDFTTTTQTPTASPSGAGTSLSDLLSKAKSMTSVKYEMVMTSPGKPPITTKVWVEGSNRREEMVMEGNITAITIINEDKQEMYSYFPEVNRGVKCDINTSARESALEEYSIENRNPMVIGTEIIEGKPCTVVEYDARIGAGRMKSWIWQKHGMPIKTELTTVEGTIIRTDYKNIEFDDIPDSLFEPPAEVELKEAESFNMPGDML
jgi:outer membrane lipoprotein-sorting protein